jgi:hypothetical protein
MLVILVISCRSYKYNHPKSNIIVKNTDTIGNLNKVIQDTFSLIVNNKKISVDFNNFNFDQYTEMSIFSVLGDNAYIGDSLAISRLVKLINVNNFRIYDHVSTPRGKRLFEHIIYNIASEIYCGNRWADPRPESEYEAISPGFMTLIDMINTINGETYGFLDVLDFTVEERNALDAKYKHLYKKKEGTYMEICPGSLQVCNDYWQIRVAYERGLIQLKDFGER